MTISSILGCKRPIAALGVAAAVLATSSLASANTTVYPALAGTTAAKSYAQWSQAGGLIGVQNDATAARDWLIPIDIGTKFCDQSQGCTVYATFRGGNNGASCVTAYFTDLFGAIIQAGSQVCQGTTLARLQIANTHTKAPQGLLVVAALAGGSATRGRIISVEFVQPGVEFTGGVIGATKGVPDNFNTVVWGEYGIGGVRNMSSAMRDWYVAVPNGNGGNLQPITTKATFGGGFGGESCVDVFGVGPDGALLSSGTPANPCRTTFGTVDYGKITGGVIVYIASLARASAGNVADGGVLSSVAY